MPTYEYQCDNCGKEFDIFQSIKDKPASVCEECGGHLTKLLSAGTGLIFKGSGFYITDYKTKSGGEDAAPSAPKEGGAAKTDTTTKTESPAKSASPAPKAAASESKAVK